MVADLPPVAAPVVIERIGSSVQGRAIRVERRGASGSDAVADVLVIGVIHGTEPGGIDIVRQLRAADLPTGVRLWIVPTLNPDGQARRTRQNARGVDLNRNFPHRWQHAGSPWSTYYSGRAAASEPETRAAQRLIRRIRPDVTVWYHQHASRVIRPAPSWARIAARAYSAESQLQVLPWQTLRGTVAGWQRSFRPMSATLVVELPAGRVRGVAVRRHVAAVRRVAVLARSFCTKHPRRCR